MARTAFFLILVKLLVCLSLQAEEFGSAKSLDPLYFLAGMCKSGLLNPPECEQFFWSEREQHVADLFVQMAQRWNAENHTTAPVEYWSYNTGKRRVVSDAPLATALASFFATHDSWPGNPVRPNVSLVEFDETKRLSFLAGVYVRSFRDGTFYDTPSKTIRAAVFILLAEGCEILEFKQRQNEVPNVLSFKVKPSERVARVFALIDSLEPPHFKWEEK